MGVTSCATLPFLPGTHVFSTVFKLLQANSTLFKHLWLVTLGHFNNARTKYTDLSYLVNPAVNSWRWLKNVNIFSGRKRLG